MERELPIINIHGTDFAVDVEKLLLRERENPQNTIAFSEMREAADGYEFDYNPAAKNVPVFFDEDKDKVTVTIPEWVDLDPAGMALKYGCTVEEAKNKTDFDLMVDHEALALWLWGRLTTVDIEGHTFYVDIPMGMLRPYDDFLSKGIVLNDIDQYYLEEKSAYVIPYNPQTHEFQEPDYERITTIPCELVLISFPHERELDPVGFNRKMGLSPLDGLSQTNIHPHFVAEKMSWQDSGINNIIRTNQEKQQRQQRAVKAAQRAGKRIRRGHGL